MCVRPILCDARHTHVWVSTLECVRVWDMAIFSIDIGSSRGGIPHCSHSVRRTHHWGLPHIGFVICRAFTASAPTSFDAGHDFTLFPCAWAPKERGRILLTPTPNMGNVIHGYEVSIVKLTMDSPYTWHTWEEIQTSYRDTPTPSMGISIHGYEDSIVKLAMDSPYTSHMWEEIHTNYRDTPIPKMGIDIHGYEVHCKIGDGFPLHIAHVSVPTDRQNTFHLQLLGIVLNIVLRLMRACNQNCRLSWDTGTMPPYGDPAPLPRNEPKLKSYRRLHNI